MTHSAIGLTADQLLTTTRSVRRRLDLDRPVEPEVLTECLELALQAPSGSNRQTWHWVFVTDPAAKDARPPCSAFPTSGARRRP